MKKLGLLLGIICLFVCLSCSKDEDDITKCSICHGPLGAEWEYSMCPNCNARICSSCIIIYRYAFTTELECPRCKHHWSRYKKQN